jgi:hypothetical protein
MVAIEYIEIEQGGKTKRSVKRVTYIGEKTAVLNVKGLKK